MLTVIAFGFFNAIRAPTIKDSVDIIVHLGDYFYEYINGDYGDGTDIGRIPLPEKKVLYSLEDFRTRIGQYRADEDLSNSHAKFPWITVWDDHEFADNAWREGAAEYKPYEPDVSAAKFGNQTWEQVKGNAVRAYYEWMPLRQVDLDDKLRIWRNFKIGKIADLIMLDTRIYDRDETDDYNNTEKIKSIANNEDRSVGLSLPFCSSKKC